MIDHDDHHSSADAALGALAALVESAAPARFDAGFADRVDARLRASRDSGLSVALERQFRRVVPLVAAASLILAAYNWWGARGLASSPLDAALNLPGVTLSAAYSPSTLFGMTSSPTENP
jgi:hypothetical protein